jgi:hypothetical protein
MVEEKKPSPSDSINKDNNEETIYRRVKQRESIENHKGRTGQLKNTPK